MTRVIYADLLFFINFLADFLIIYLTGVFFGCGCRLSGSLLSALLGASIGTVCICFGNAGLCALLIIIIAPPLMCLIAFGKRSIRTFGRLIFYFFFSSVILYGGVYAMAAVFSLIFRGIDISKCFLFTILFIIATVFLYLVFSSLCSKAYKRDEGCVRVDIFDGKRNYSLSLLVDSGNMARDPFSAKPVVIVSKNAFDNELLSAVCSAFDNDDKNSGYGHIKPRVIPMKTVSGTTLLYAFVPESMHIIIGKKKIKADCIIAIDSHENAFFGNDGLIPKVLIETV